ncbi:MAG: hypothetical protein K2N25_08515 [Muribaculaceae bacterium]|nr:hypothetical protein [Muribaculaceae bacterium]
MMNKYIARALCVAMVCAATACGGKSGKHAKTKTAMQTEYIEACNEKDYDKARGIVEKMKPLYEGDINAVTEHFRYINEKEIYSLLSKPSKDNDLRILYLYNVHEPSELPDMEDVVEVAVSMGNENLPERLIKAGVDPTMRIAKAAVNADMGQLVELIVTKHPDFILDQEVRKFLKDDRGSESYRKTLSELFASSDKDMREQLIKIGRAEKVPEVAEWVSLQQEEIRQGLNDRYREILATKLPTRPALGTIKSDHYGDLPKEYVEYNQTVEAFNNSLKDFITDAVSLGETALANKALGQMKQTLEQTVIGDWVRVVEHEYDHSSVYNAIKVTLSDSQINDARKIIQNGN